MFGYIYKTTNLINNRVYIGKKKSTSFISDYYGSGIALKEAIKKYGKSNFVIEILEWADTKEELDDLEIKNISFFSSIYNLYNIAKGGNGGDTVSHHPNKEAIYRKRSESLKNWHSSLTSEVKREYNKKISNSKKGKSNGHEGLKHSKETKEKIRVSNINLDKGNGPEWINAHKEAMAKRKGKPLPAKYKPVIVNGVEYESIKMAQELLGIKHRATFYKKVKQGHILLEYK